MRILVNAYAVCPDKGSEPGMGWNWITSLAAHFPLEVVTELEFRDQILAAVANHPCRDNLSFHFIDIGGARVRDMCWNQGDWRFYRYYRRWQLVVEAYARTQVAAGHVTHLHQLNMIGYREPGFLWRIPGVPLSWGPVGGFGNIPSAFVSRFPVKERLKQRVKSLINGVQYWSPRVQSMIRCSNLILAANGNSYEVLNRFAPGRTHLVNDAASRPGLAPVPRPETAGPLRLCWVGKWMPRKALWIALDSIRAFSSDDVLLDVVGMNEDEGRKDSVTLPSNAHFHGVVSHARSLEVMAQSDALLFTSLHEGTPHVVLEALGCGTPVLCHDAWGQGDIVDTSCGIKVALRDPSTSIAGFDEAIRCLLADRVKLGTMRKFARERAETVTWERSAAQVANLINNIKPQLCDF